MSTHISIGFSQDPTPSKAILQACVHIKSELNTAYTDLIIIFASPQYIIPELQTIISRTLKPKHLVGSSTGGIILSNGVTNRGIAILGINSDEMTFSVAANNDFNNKDMHFIGFDLARRAMQDLQGEHRELFLTFSDGLEINNTFFVRGIKEALGGGFPLLGAISSDDFKHTHVYQFFEDQILKHSIVGLMLGGSFHLAFANKHGFKPLGKPRTITKIDGHVIRTIDNKPAIDLYKHFLGNDLTPADNHALKSTADIYPLGIYLEESKQYLLRNIVDILEDGSIVCHEGIPQGSEVHLMISNKDLCLNSALDAAESITKSLGERQPKLILIFESLSRHKILGRNAYHEIQRIKDVFGNNVPIVGMCTYGEIGPFGSLSDIKNVYLHNESIIIIAIA